MPNVTFSVPDDLYERMKKFPEIKWPTLYRQMIEKVLEKLEKPHTESIIELRERLKNKGFSMDDIPFDRAVELYKKMRELEWERVFSTQMD